MKGSGPVIRDLRRKYTQAYAEGRLEGACVFPRFNTDTFSGIEQDSAVKCPG